VSGAGTGNKGNVEQGGDLIKRTSYSLLGIGGREESVKRKGQSKKISRKNPLERTAGESRL